MSFHPRTFWNSSSSFELYSGITSLGKSYCTPLVRINHFLFHACPWDCAFRSVRAGDRGNKGKSHLPFPQYPLGIMLAWSNLENRNRVYILLSNLAHRTGAHVLEFSRPHFTSCHLLASDLGQVSETPKFLIFYKMGKSNDLIGLLWCLKEVTHIKHNAYELVINTSQLLLNLVGGIT